MSVRNRTHDDVDLDYAVVEGLDLSTQETVDIGAKRTLADILRLRGEANTAVLAAALRLLCA